jgi:hypothetical protein
MRALEYKIWLRSHESVDDGDWKYRYDLDDYWLQFYYRNGRTESRCEEFVLIATQVLSEAHIAADQVSGQ